ncbi:MAG: FliH/SctL family protein [Thermodesulfobacteriota bacterium]
MSRIYKHTPGLEHARPLVMEPLASGGVFTGGRSNNDAVGGGTTAATIEREAYARGFKSGEKAGFELGRQKAEILFSGLGKIMDELSGFKASLYAPCVEEMVELSLAIARKVLHCELETNKDSVLSCVQGALKSVVAGGEITIKVNPRDLDIIRQHAPQLAKHGDGVQDVAMEGDDSIARGGCVIDTRFGEIDATIDSVMEELEAHLRDAH